MDSYMKRWTHNSRPNTFSYSYYFLSVFWEYDGKRWEKNILGFLFNSLALSQLYSCALEKKKLQKLDTHKNHDKAKHHWFYREWERFLQDVTICSFQVKKKNIRSFITICMHTHTVQHRLLACCCCCCCCC